MRNYLSYITCLIAAAFISSCVKIDIQPLEQVPVGDLTSVTLQLKSSDLVATRVLGDDNLNENCINHIQCFFSVNDNDGIDNNTIVYATDVITIPANQAEAQSGTVTDLEITIPSDKMTPLFSDGNCSVYVVANGPAAGIDVTEGTTTIAGVKATAVSLGQYETSGEGENMISQAAAQPSFVMDGDAVVSKETDKISGIVKIRGTVPLYRVAAKILVNLNVASQIVYDNGTPDTNDDVTWEPKLDEIKISYINSLTESTLAAKSPNTVEEGDLNDYLQQPYGNYKVYDIQEGTEGETIICTQEIPFYTYPYDWSGSNNPEPAISLIIPWTSGNIKQYFEYQIPINPKKTEKEVTTDTKSLVRNTVYEMTVNVGILGGLTEPVNLSPSYIVTDWGTGAINAELSRPTYLIVDEHYVEMNNENSHAVGFSASDKDNVSAVITKIIKPDYSDRVPVENNALYNSSGVTSFSPTANQKGYGNTNPFTVSVDKNNGTIVLNHELNNTMNSNGFDYVPYTVTVKVTMTVDDDDTFEEIIEFKQYPAMYVTAHTNMAFVQHGNDYYDNNNSPRNTFVNGWYSVYGNRYTDYENVENTPTKFGHVPGLVASSNANPNQYVLNVSSFSSDQPYVIADSRVTVSDTNLGSQAPTWAKANYVDFNLNQGNGTRQLQYYYPTDASVITGRTDKTEPETYLTGYYVAPKLRIASSYSVVDEEGCDTMQEAKRRCASYQENGYPAGRWRMATYAEIELIVSLSYRGIIPALFTSTAWYWCAHGAVQGNASTGDVSLKESGGVSVRCVYDEWYWGSNQLANPNTFTWGDVSRN